MVWLVYYKYVPGWHTIHPDIFHEINNEPIHQMYNNCQKVLMEAITYNIMNIYDIDAYPEYYNENKPIKLNSFTIDELEKLHIKLINSLEGIKYTYKYCDIMEWSIKD
jgi:hypothetical protein